MQQKPVRTVPVNINHTKWVDIFLRRGWYGRGTYMLRIIPWNLYASVTTSHRNVQSIAFSPEKMSICLVWMFTVMVRTGNDNSTSTVPQSNRVLLYSRTRRAKWRRGYLLTLHSGPSSCVDSMKTETSACELPTPAVEHQYKITMKM